MSRLFYSEQGRVIPTLCEELTRFRRVRKTLDLPATRETAALYILARAYPNTQSLLHLAINQHRLESLAPSGRSIYQWYRVDLDPALLVPGGNIFDLWTDSRAMDSWSLALEAGHAEPASWVTGDDGETWRNHHQGYLNAVRGEYVLRIRLAEGQDPAPPPLVWEPTHHPRLQSLREILPAGALNAGSDLSRIRALTGWLSSSWEHTNASIAAQYGPWDAETILAWGKAQAGHGGRRPIVMCVHYAAAFCSCCQAAGIPARCAILMDEINGWNGHFVAEAWLANYDKWAMIDPNLDVIFWQDNRPMSLTEIMNTKEGLADLVEWGPGTTFQRKNPRIEPWLQENYLTGHCFQHRSVWWRADLLARPEFSPPGHGSLVYCETGLVWEQRDLEAGFGMFPYFGSPNYFNDPPVTNSTGSAT